MERAAAVDEESLTCGEGRVVRLQEGDRADEVGGPLEPRQRAGLDDVLAHLDRLGARILLREGAAGTYQVHADVVLPDFARDRPVEADERGLRGDVVRPRRDPAEDRARPD